MAIIGKQKFSQDKMDKLQQYVQTYSDKGKPVEYEILVDGFKAVRRTGDPDMFTMYESFVGTDTGYIEVLFYTGTSNNNDKHLFTLREEPKEAGLSGIEVENIIEEKLDEQKKHLEREKMIQDNKDLKKEVAGQKEKMDSLEQELEECKASKSPLTAVLGDLGASVVESLVKRNRHALAKIPGGEALAGVMGIPFTPDVREEEGEVSFKAKDESKEDNKGLSPEDEFALTFVGQLRKQFTRNEFEEVLRVLEQFALDKEKIKEVIHYLTDNSDAGENDE